MDWIKLDLIFNRTGRLNHNGKALVQIQAYLNGCRRYFSTKVYLLPTEWDTKRKEPKEPFVRARVRAMLADHEKYLQKCHAEGKHLTLADLDQYASRPTKKEVEVKQTFTDFAMNQLKNRSAGLAFATYKSEKSTLKLLGEFKPIIEFSELKFSLVNDFDNFLTQKGHNENTRRKRHSQIQQYIRLAIKYEHLSKDPYQDFNKPRAECKRDYLLPEELQQIENLTFEREVKQLEKVRDMFLFACYTGLRFSDVSVLTSDSFIETNEGLRLYKMAQKTKKTLDLPLNLLFGGKPENLAKKYWRNDTRNKLFGFTNQFVNRELKTLARRAGIKKHLTFHVARHTAATIIAKKVGVLEAKNLLQHSKLETTNQYLHSSDKDRDARLSDVTNWY